MNMRFVGLCSLALAAVVSPMIAHAQGGRGGRGGPGGFGGGMFGMQAGSGANELLQLLRREEVRSDEEVAMPEEVWTAVQEKQGEIFGALRGMRDMSEDERNEAMKKMDDQAKELLDEVVLPEAQKRLMGMLVQLNGLRAAANPMIAKEIGLTEDEQKGLGEALQKAGEEMRAKMQEMFSSGERPDPAAMQEMRDKNQKEVEAALKEKLTEKQQSDLMALKGKEVKFAETPGFGFGGGRGGPGGGRGQGRGQGRGTNDN